MKEFTVWEYDLNPISALNIWTPYLIPPTHNVSAYQIIGKIYADERGSMYLETEVATYRTTQRHNHETTA
jgi:hypothetical protein